MKTKIAILSTTRSGHNFIKAVIESWLPDCVITVLENCLPKDIWQYKLDPRSFNIIVIRGFKNFLASSVKSYLDEHGLASPWRESMGLKIKAYRAILGESKTKGHFDHDMIIYYDLFCVNTKYREELCKQLGGQYTEERLGFVSDEGNGSSFDHLDYQGEGYKMKVLDRHKQILDTPWAMIYEQLLNENKDLWL